MNKKKGTKKRMDTSNASFSGGYYTILHGQRVWVKQYSKKYIPSNLNKAESTAGFSNMCSGLELKEYLK